MTSEENPIFNVLIVGPEASGKTTLITSLSRYAQQVGQAIHWELGRPRVTSASEAMK